MQRVDEVPDLPVRPIDAHKGIAGLVLVVAGSRGMEGAASLVGNAALRGGAGLVRIATPDDCHDTVAALTPCCTSHPLPTSAGREPSGREWAEIVCDLAAGQDALAIGPGLGQRGTVRTMVRQVLADVEAPVVLDADGLNAVTDGARADLARSPAPIIATPHPGEAGRLLGRSAKDIQADREATAEELSRWCHVAVLKGAGTIVTDGERMYVNETGNPGMATAGAGDVLTGLMAALIAGGMEPFGAAVRAVWTHGKAGDLAAEAKGQLSLMATDILACLPEALSL